MTVHGLDGAAAASSLCALLTTHNRRETTLRCLEGLFTQVGPGAEITAVVVDAGSTDGTPDAVEERFPLVRVVRVHADVYWATGMAIAEREARRGSRPDFLLWLNDDVVLDRDAIARLLALHDRIGANPHLICGAVRDPDSARTTYGGVERYDWHPLRYRMVMPADDARQVDTAHGNALLVPAATYELLTAIDGKFVQSYADFDYGERLRRVGGSVWLAPGHVGSCSANDSRRRELYATQPWRARWSWLLSPKGISPRCHLRYLRRHGGPAWMVFAAMPYARFLVRRRSGPTPQVTGR